MASLRQGFKLFLALNLLEERADTFPVNDEAGAFPSNRLGKSCYCFAYQSGHITGVRVVAEVEKRSRLVQQSCGMAKVDCSLFFVPRQHPDLDACLLQIPHSLNNLILEPIFNPSRSNQGETLLHALVNLPHKLCPVHNALVGGFKGERKCSELLLCDDLVAKHQSAKTKPSELGNVLVRS